MDGFAIVLSSDELERVQAVSIISSVAAASEIPVDIFVTMNGFRAFEKEVIRSRDFNGGEAAEAMLNAEDVEVPLYPEQLEQAKSLGPLSIHACEMTMELMGKSLDDMVDLFDGTLGVAGFLNAAEDKQVIFV
jgi:peroxiredoxin family protein